MGGGSWGEVGGAKLIERINASISFHSPLCHTTSHLRPLHSNRVERSLMPSLRTVWKVQRTLHLPCRHGFTLMPSGQLPWLSTVLWCMVSNSNNNNNNNNNNNLVIISLFSGNYDLSSFNHDPNDNVSVEISRAIFDSTKSLRFTGMSVSLLP